jgi:hypothetical protein
MVRELVEKALDLVKILNHALLYEKVAIKEGMFVVPNDIDRHAAAEWDREFSEFINEIKTRFKHGEFIIPELKCSSYYAELNAILTYLIEIANYVNGLSSVKPDLDLAFFTLEFMKLRSKYFSDYTRNLIDELDKTLRQLEQALKTE